MQVKMVFESLAPHELCQIIWNQVTICWDKYQSKFRFSSLSHSLSMFYCYPSIKINEVILVVNNMTLKTLRSDIIVSPLHVAPISCIKVEAFRRGFQKSTAVVPFSQGCVFFWRISSRLSQQYVQVQGGPIICTIQDLLSTLAIASR